MSNRGSSKISRGHVRYYDEGERAHVYTDLQWQGLVCLRQGNRD